MTVSYVAYTVILWQCVNCWDDTWLDDCEWLNQEGSEVALAYFKVYPGTVCLLTVHETYCIKNTNMTESIKSCL